MATRKNTSASGCISATAMRAKKNEPPQMAPSRSSCPQSVRFIWPRLAAGLMAVMMVGLRWMGSDASFGDSRACRHPKQEACRTGFILMA